MRLVLELTQLERGRVEGVLAREENDERQRFSGWLELLRLLEAAGDRPADQHPSGGHPA